MDLSANNALLYLHCRDNQLTSLDLSSNTVLKELDCDKNLITNLVLPENNTLTKLICYNNQLTSLDLSANTALTHIRCSENQLISLDVRNGNNSSVAYFEATNNPDLNCIFIDDKNAPYLSNWIIDSISTFVETEIECEAVYINTFDEKPSFSIYPNPTDGNVTLEFTENNIQKFIICDITGKQVIEKTQLKQNETLNLKDLENGVYIISILTVNQIYTTKVIKK